MNFISIICILLYFFSVACCKDLSIIKLINNFDSLLLEVRHASSDGADVVIWDRDDGKKQRWIVDLDQAKNGNCATFESLDQDGGRLKVLDEDVPTNKVSVWGNAYSGNQFWCLVMAGNYWQIKNKQTNRCIINQGRGNQVKTEVCNVNDTKQRWAIEDANESPMTWIEHWWEHRQVLNRVYLDNEVSVYYDNNMSRSVTWPFYFTGDVWKYTKRIYGNFGPSGRLFAIFHKGTYSGGHPGEFFSASHDNKNVIDCGSLASDAWEPKREWYIDVIIHEIGHIVEFAFNRYEGSPAFPLWGDSKWMDIYTYDVYKGLGMSAEANNRYSNYIQSYENFPYPGRNTYWFRDWFYPIYSVYGESSVLKRFFEMLVAHFPKRGFQYTRNMNMGEFVHFWSGAARTNLKAQATKAFGWNSQLDSEFNKARIDFPNIIY